LFIVFSHDIGHLDTLIKLPNIFFGGAVRATHNINLFFAESLVGGKNFIGE